MLLTRRNRDQIRAQARQAHPAEACGVVIISRGRQLVRPCRNIAARPGRRFRLSPHDFLAAEQQGPVVACYHSHPGPALPGPADQAACDASGMPYIIVGRDGQITTIRPARAKPGLLGRRFRLGYADCYTLVRDYYARFLGIAINAPSRTDRWWRRGENVFMDSYAQEGFRPVPELQTHDVVVMQLRACVPEHVAVYLDGGLILQQLCNRLSGRDWYTDYYQDHTVLFLRHKDLI